MVDRNGARLARNVFGVLEPTDVAVEAKFQKIIASPTIDLKPNKHFKDVAVPHLFQRKGILAMLMRDNMILGDDCGLGKTLQAICHFTYIKSRYPDAMALVLTEKIALKQWVNEIKWLTKGLTSKIVTATTHVNKDLRVSAMRQCPDDFFVTTYSMIYNYADYIFEGRGKRWILYADEPNYFANTATKLQMQMCAALDRRPPSRRYGLTATIIENRLEEAFGIMRVITPGVFQSWKEFESNHCIMRKTRRGPVRTGYKNLADFRMRVHSVFLGRAQTDAEVDMVLPEVFVKDVEIELSVPQTKKLIEAEDQLIEDDKGKVKKLLLLPAMIVQQQIVDDPKTAGFNLHSAKKDALVEMLLGSMAGQKVIVFSKLRMVIDQLEVALDKNKITNARITGAEDVETRDEAKDKFWDKGPTGVQVLLITRAGSKGANLQAGKHLIFFDLPWSWGLYKQTRGRIVRGGSEHERVGVYHFLAEKHPAVTKSEQTIDHHTLKVVKRKLGLANVLKDEGIDITDSSSDIQEIFAELKRGR
jgi:SNF2 family DNA or RNA helicase